MNFFEVLPDIADPELLIGGGDPVFRDDQGQRGLPGDIPDYLVKPPWIVDPPHIGYPVAALALHGEEPLHVGGAVVIDPHEIEGAFKVGHPFSYPQGQADPAGGDPLEKAAVDRQVGQLPSQFVGDILRAERLQVKVRVGHPHRRPGEVVFDDPVGSSLHGHESAEGPGKGERAESERGHLPAEVARGRHDIGLVERQPELYQIPQALRHRFDIICKGGQQIISVGIAAPGSDP